MMLMRAVGRLKIHGVLQYPTISRAANGEPVTTWTDSEHVWLALEDASGWEKFVNKKETAGNVYRIFFRRPAVLPNESWRLLLDDGRKISFVSVADEGAMMKCVGEEVI